MRYTYLGDRFTDRAFIKAQCEPIRRSDGKCIVGRNATQLVDFGHGPVVVFRRRLRVNREEPI